MWPAISSIAAFTWLCSLIAKAPDRDAYSLSCNPDVLLDLADAYQRANLPLYVVGVVHPNLPYLGGEAAVEADFFDLIVESPEVKHQLFSLPLEEVTPVDNMIGFHASQLVADDGTLQIGIGSLSDALVASLRTRQHDGLAYQDAVRDFWKDRAKPPEVELHSLPLEKGLYGTSEMLMDGFMHLRKAGILRRRVFDEDEVRQRYMHGAFFLGSKSFYQWLRDLDGEDFKGLSMTRVSKVNDLYDPNEFALRRQRKNARFFNTCMSMHLLGAAVSDTLPDGRVVSGIGGQYNFVAMAHELSGAHSVLMLRSSRRADKGLHSNIVADNGQFSIARHLRDVAVTEYGIACLRGKTDQECIAALIHIADARFQEELLDFAKSRHKLPFDYKLAPWAKDNTPGYVRDFVGRHRKKGFFEAQPFGTDFTPEEENLKQALSALRSSAWAAKISCLLRGVLGGSADHEEELNRMDLLRPVQMKDHLEKALVLGALRKWRSK
jgi:acyl-CoA hydrolase